MTKCEFDVSTSSPRRGFAVAAGHPFNQSGPVTVMAPLTEFHATMADVTNEQHQNMAELVQSDDFNADVVVHFLRDNGIDASVDESTSGFRYTAANATRASHVRFACVCLRASISYAIEAAYWCAKAKR